MTRPRPIGLFSVRSVVVTPYYVTPEGDRFGSTSLSVAMCARVESWHPTPTVTND